MFYFTCYSLLLYKDLMSRCHNENYIPKETSNLNNNSKIMIIQLRILDKKKILNKIGSIEDNKISNKIDKVIR